MREYWLLAKLAQMELVPYSELIDIEIDLKNNLIDSGLLNAI